MRACSQLKGIGEVIFLKNIVIDSYHVLLYICVA